MANEITTDVPTQEEVDAAAKAAEEAPVPAPAEAPDPVEVQTKTRELRLKLAKVHQLAARTRTQSNAISEKAGRDPSYLLKLSLEEIDNATEALQLVDESLTALLALQ